jgi:hypothetical protein
MVRSELLEVITVFMAVGSLRFDFVLGFSAGLFFPVHVRKRNGRVRPAMTAQFFRLPSVVLGKSLDRDTICGGQDP